MRCLLVLLLVCVATLARNLQSDETYENNEILVDEKPFKVETDYANPVRCEDPETGKSFKLGSEWYEMTSSKCLKKTCEPRYFPEVNIIKCEDYFITANPKIVCDSNKRGKWPNCCSQCGV